MSAIDSSASQTADARPTFRRPKIVLPVPTPASKFQKAQPGVPDTQKRPGSSTSSARLCSSTTLIVSSSRRMS
jgi:hypothetical protein